MGGVDGAGRTWTHTHTHTHTLKKYLPYLSSQDLYKPNLTIIMKVWKTNIYFVVFKEERHSLAGGEGVVEERNSISVFSGCFQVIKSVEK